MSESNELTEALDVSEVEAPKPKPRKRKPKPIDMKALVKVKNVTNRMLNGIRPGDTGKVTEARARAWHKYLERV